MCNKADPLENYVGDLDEAQKVAGTLRFWLRGGTRDTIQDMHRLISDGKVRLVKGFARKIDVGTDGAEVLVEDDAGLQRRHATGFVVNCAGAGPKSLYDPVTEDLLRQGLIARGPKGGGLHVGDGCHAGSDRLRYLSPAVTRIGSEVVAMPLYDAHMLRTYVARATRPV